MSEIGFICTDVEVRAIFDGSMAQMRRAVEPQPEFDGSFWNLGAAAWSDGVSPVPVMPGHSLWNRCPYGVPGDRLYVQESIRFNDEHANAYYCADDRGVGEERYLQLREIRRGRSVIPAIHMFRWASRIDLEVVAVCIERVRALQDKVEGPDWVWVVEFRRIVPE